MQGVVSTNRCHISHTAGDRVMQPSLRVMNSNVEVGEMGMSCRVQKDVIWFDVSAE